MKKLADFLVDKRYPLLAFMLAAALVCAFLAAGMETNRDMTKYLPKGSNMRQGLDIMETVFPDAESAVVRVMFTGLAEGEADTIRARLESIPDVSAVAYEAGSEDYERDGNTLFVVSTASSYGSGEEQAVEDAIGQTFSGYDMVYRSNDVQSTKVTPVLLAGAVAMALAILIVMSQSWLEPVLFAATIGVAIVINLGTNVIFPYVSEMTASIGPIIQLVLSMDYSIILMNRYRQEKAACPDKAQAMKDALRACFSSIASSALTTVVGLLALVFLSFKMGPELAIVLAKGVFISMLCVFTVLPVLILVCDKGIEKSRKPAPRMPMGLAAKFSYKARFVMPILFAGLLVGFYILQGGTGITFIDDTADPIAEVFPKENTVVLVYSDQDEDSIPDVIAAMDGDEHILSVTGYANTLGQSYDAQGMARALAVMDGGAGLDESVVRALYYDYFSGGEALSMTAGEFAAFLQSDVLADESLAPRLDGDMAQSAALLGRFSDPETLTAPMTAAEMAALFGMDEAAMQSLFTLYFSEAPAPDGETQAQTMTLTAFADFVLNTVAADEAYAAMFDENALAALGQLQAYAAMDPAVGGAELTAPELAAQTGMDPAQVESLYALYFAGSQEAPAQFLTPQQFVSFAVESVLPDPAFAGAFDQQTAQQLTGARIWIDAVAGGEKYDAEDMTALLGSLTEGIGQEQVSLIYLLYGGFHALDDNKVMTIPELFGYLRDDVLQDGRFAAFIDSGTAQTVKDAGAQLDEAAAQLKNGGYCRLIFTTDYPEESDETGTFMEKLDGLRRERLQAPSYLVGTSAMVYEMDASFADEYRTISLITAAAIFLVVLLTFRSLAIPALLTLLVQCGVYITVTVIGLFGGSMYYLALLIVQSILMGATIDYGIVFSTYYREKRRTLDRPDALRAAYEGSIHTIMTSGSILVLVLAVLGLFASSFVAQVCKTLSIGSLVAILLILFVLPAMLACFDQFVVRRKDTVK